MIGNACLGRLRGGVALCVMLCASVSAQAIIKHYPLGHEEVPSLRPSDGVMGRWNTNASAVVIGPNYILTARHQGGGTGGSVYIGGVQYVIGEVSNVVQAGQNPDMRVARIWTTDGRPANLTNWVGLWDTSLLGTEENKPIVMGGFGKVRAANDNTNPYEWVANTTQSLNWGANTIGTGGSPNYWYENNVAVSGYVSDTLILDFDSASQGVAYEAAVAEYDSGGGWFIYNSADQKWYVAALSAYAAYGATYFSPPQRNWGIRVSTYATWIRDHSSQFAIPDGDANLDGKVDIGDLGILSSNYGKTTGMSWQTGDFYRDGVVDVGDLGILATNYGADWTAGGGGASMSAVPEPGSLLFLVLTAAGLLPRKRLR